MNREDFIKDIASLVKVYAPQYGIKVHSPIIAQAILESACGASELAQNACNYFGLKFRPNRCKTCIGIYTKDGSEQNPDGSYTTSTMKWCKFADMKGGVIGYFDFINIPNYSNLKGVDDPLTYLENIKKDGYATSHSYVKNLMAVIEKYNLTQYDEPRKENVKMGNSPLATYTHLTNHHSGKRTHSIDTFTPHCIVGQWTGKQTADYFANTDREASCNYAIGRAGDIAVSVNEDCRSWCSSSRANDQRAVTVECASDTTHPYAMTEEVFNSLINLCVDICKRHGKTKVIWFGDKNKTLNYYNQIKPNEMVITVHRWFAAKACPGDWLYNRLGEFANKVNARLGGTTPIKPEPEKPEVPSGNYPATPFLVQVLISDLRIRKTPKFGDNDTGKHTGKGVFTITEVSDDWGKLKSGAGYIYLANPKYTKIQGDAPAKPHKPKVGDKIKLKDNHYYNGVTIPSWVMNSTLYYRGNNPHGVIFSTLKTGAITGVVKEDNVIW